MIYVAFKGVNKIIVVLQVNNSMVIQHFSRSYFFSLQFWFFLDIRLEHLIPAFFGWVYWDNGQVRKQVQLFLHFVSLFTIRCDLINICAEWKMFYGKKSNWNVMVEYIKAIQVNTDDVWGNSFHNLSMRG